MLQVLITEEAERDLLEIAEYTEAHWGVKQRDWYNKRLEQRIFYLAENPTHGKLRDEIKPGYFSYTEGKHAIFYLCDSQNLTVISSLHERMDFARHL